MDAVSQSPHKSTTIAGSSLASPTMAIDNTSKSYYGRVHELLSLYFPNYGILDFKRIPVSSSGETKGDNKWMLIDEPKNSGTSVEEGVKFRCEVILFGMPVCTTTLYTDWEAAKESTSESAYHILIEILKLVRGRQNDVIFGKVFAPLVKEFEAFKMVAVDADVLLAKREDKGVKMAMGHQRVLTLAQHEASEEAKASVLGPTLSAILHKVNNPRSNDNDENDKGKEKAEPVGTKKETSTKSSIEIIAKMAPQKSADPGMNPISLLYQHYQKRSAVVAQPLIENFARKNYYGAIGRYHDAEVLVKAVYRKKTDAKYEAARLLCEKIIGDVVTFPRMEPDVVDQDGGVVATDYVMANTQTITNTIKSDVSGIVMPKVVEANLSADLLGELPSGPLGEEHLLPEGRKYVSAINEYCQVMHLPFPDYTYLTVNQSLTSAHCCRVALFDRRPFMSYAFTRKSDAKEDCAGRIFLHLQERGVMKGDGRMVRNMQQGQQQRNQPHSRYGGHQNERYSRGGSPHMMPPPMMPPMPPPGMQMPLPSKRHYDGLNEEIRAQYPPQQHPVPHFMMPRPSLLMPPHMLPPSPYPPWMPPPGFPSMPPPNGFPYPPPPHPHNSNHPPYLPPPSPYPPPQNPNNPSHYPRPGDSRYNNSNNRR